MSYPEGQGVKKKRGPKGPSKVKGPVLDALLEEFESHPSDPSHIIAGRVAGRTGVKVSPRRIREIRHERGKRRSSMRLSGGASPRPSRPTLSYRS